VREELQANRLLFETLLKNPPAAVAMFDTEMRYLAWSNRWLTDYNLEDRDLRGLSHYEVFPEIGENWKAVHRRCLAGATESRDDDHWMGRPTTFAG
jgi:PAS domain-containing protein